MHAGICLLCCLASVKRFAMLEACCATTLQGSGSVLATRNLHVLRRLVAADLVRAAAAFAPHGGTLMARGDLRAAVAVPVEVRQQLLSSRKALVALYAINAITHNILLKLLCKWDFRCNAWLAGYKCATVAAASHRGRAGSRSASAGSPLFHARRSSSAAFLPGFVQLSAARDTASALCLAWEQPVSQRGCCIAQILAQL